MNNRGQSNTMYKAYKETRKADKMNHELVVNRGDHTSIWNQLMHVIKHKQL